MKIVYNFCFNHYIPWQICFAGQRVKELNFSKHIATHFQPFGDLLKKNYEEENEIECISY